MKKFLPVIIILLSCSSMKSQSSTYHPMLADSNVWAVYMDVIPLLAQNPHQPPTVQNMGPAYVHKIKDTIVDSMNYVMVYSRTNEDYPSEWSLLREDTATQKVYLLTAGDTAERIIYDFSLNAGDSIWLDFSYQGFGYLVSGWWHVDSTNTYQIDAGPRKALYLSNPQNPLHNGQPRFLQWIESVGCNLSPVYLDEQTPESISPVEYYFPQGCTQNRHMYSVTCAWQDGVQTFSSECWEVARQNIQFNYPNGDTCIFILMGAIHDPAIGMADQQLIPNPASDHAQLTFEASSAVVFGITITNILGEQVRTVSPATWYARGKHAVDINLEGLPAGIYSVNLEGEAGVVALRLIVQ